MNNEESKVYFVGGINAVGKTTLLNEVKFVKPEFEIVRGSEFFMKWLGIRPGDYDSLRSLSDEHKNIEFDKMMRWLVEQKPKEGKHLVIDAHYLNIKPEGIVNVTGDWISLMDALFVITAPNIEVLDRMEKDEKKKGRSRSIFPELSTSQEKLDLIKSFQDRTLLLAKNLSNKFHLPLIEIKNRNGEISIAVDEFVKSHQLIMANN
jgi:adenylate kinase